MSSGVIWLRLDYEGVALSVVMVKGKGLYRVGSAAVGKFSYGYLLPG